MGRGARSGLGGVVRRPSAAPSPSQLRRRRRLFRAWRFASARQGPHHLGRDIVTPESRVARVPDAWQPRSASIGSCGRIGRLFHEPSQARRRRSNARGDLLVHPILHIFIHNYATACIDGEFFSIPQFVQFLFVGSLDARMLRGGYSWWSTRHFSSIDL